MPDLTEREVRPGKNASAFFDFFITNSCLYGIAHGWVMAIVPGRKISSREGGMQFFFSMEFEEFLPTDPEKTPGSRRTCGSSPPRSLMNSRTRNLNPLAPEIS
jgi:hypothetical protein